MTAAKAPLPRPVRLMMVEDHGLILALIERWLERFPEFTVVGSVSNGEEGLERLAGWQPDLLLVDLRLPGMDGLEFIRLARGRRAEVRVLVISSMVDPLALTRIRRAGVDGYLEKEASPEELVEALRTVADGQTAFSEKFYQTLAEEDGRSQAIGKILSCREQQVLSLLLEGKGNKAIALHLALSPRTVEFHRANLMAKLDAGNLSELILNARRRGWGE